MERDAPVKGYAAGILPRMVRTPSDPAFGGCDVFRRLLTSPPLSRGGRFCGRWQPQLQISDYKQKIYVCKSDGMRDAGYVLVAHTDS